MAAITLSVPDELKRRMAKIGWVNWSSVAREAFSERLKDIEELELRKKIAEISEIPEGDNREIRKELAEDVVRSIGKTVEELKSGRIKPMTLEELDELMGLK